MSLNLVIKRTGAGAPSQEFPVDIDPSSTVAELKEQIAGNVELPAENIRLVCAGRVWDNVATIASYSPGAGSVVHCLNNPTRAAPAAAAQTLTAANPMQQMMAMGMPQTDSDPNDPYAQMEARMQQQMMQNPEMMQTMMRMNPRMNRLMEERPEIARMMQDPEVIQQSMRMMQNPELMREMVRNQDRSIGNLDVMPGGHQALVNAHSEILDPLHAAMSGGNGAAGTAPVAVYDNAATANNEAMPNPFAPARPTPPAAAAPAPAAALPSPPAGQVAGNSQPPPNPMQQMMQQMMSNPAMMQPPPMANAPPQGTAQNPMQQMMQQMMSNPAAMQQAMAMMNPQSQAQTGGANAGGFNAGGFGGPGFGGPNFQTMLQQMNAAQGAGQQGAGAAEVPEAVLRMRFASQLVQLANMGFTDESVCLRALAQHNGRLDSVIDVLLTGSGE
jgi:ubiquilin